MKLPTGLPTKVRELISKKLADTDITSYNSLSELAGFVAGVYMWETNPKSKTKIILKKFRADVLIIRNSI